jgi:single-stranded-DNA-specific exonuclease
MGVVGLVAARLTETHYLPSVVGAFGEEFTRASCRSIPEFHITHALDECADLFERHGGHAMAAGFTVRNDRLVELKQRLKTIAERELRGRDLKPVIKVDMEIGFKELKPEILKWIDALEPTGHQNREALFVSRKLRVVRSRTVGSDQRHLRLTVSDGGVTYDAIGFRLGHWAEQMPEKVDLLFAYERNVFQGRETLQLNVRDLRPAG